MTGQWTTEAVTDRQAQRVERYEEALQRVVQWADAYPIDTFPEPLDLTAIRAKIGDNEMSRLHASWARHLTKGIGDIARGALADE